MYSWTLSGWWSNTLIKWPQRATINYGDCDKFVDVSEQKSQRNLLALVTSRLDYCNSVLAALPQSTTEPLQCIQNTAARLIFNIGRCEHVSPCLIQLHWLPIRHKITYTCTSSAPSCTTFTSESLRVIWPKLCSLRLPEWHAPVCALSLKQPATCTSHLGCAPSVESGFLFLRPSVMELSPHWTTHHFR